MVEIAPVWFSGIAGSFFLAHVFLKAVVVVVIVIDGGKIQDGLVTQMLVQEKIVLADADERQERAGEQNFSGIVEGVERLIHAFFSIHADAEERFHQSLVDAEHVPVGHGYPVALLNLGWP